MSQVAVTDIVLGTEGSNSGITVEMPFTTIARLEPGQSVIVPLKIYILHTSCEHLRVTVSFQYMCPRGSALKIISTAVDIINGGLEKACNALATMAETILSSLGSKPCVYKPQITGPDTLTESATNYFIAPLPSENKCPECTPLKCTDFVWTATGDAEIDGSHQGCGIMAKLKTTLTNDGQGTLKAEYVDKPKQVNGCKINSLVVEAVPLKPDGVAYKITSTKGPNLKFEAKSKPESCTADIEWSVTGQTTTGKTLVFTPPNTPGNITITARDKRTDIPGSAIAEVVPLSIEITKVTTPSGADTLPVEYRSTRSFVEGDYVDATAKIHPDAAHDAFASNIQWKAINKDISTDVVTKSGEELYFKINPPALPVDPGDFELTYKRPKARRNGPLRYDITAKLIEGSIVSHTYTIQQDNLDRLRQEYLDFKATVGGAPLPGRTKFSRAADNPGYGRFIKPNSGDYGWYIVSDLKIFVDGFENTLGRSLNVTSGYRTPALNKALGRFNSSHIFGRAVDYNQGSNEPEDIASQLNWDVWHFQHTLDPMMYNLKSINSYENLIYTVYNLDDSCMVGNRGLSTYNSFPTLPQPFYIDCYRTHYQDTVSVGNFAFGHLSWKWNGEK